MTPRTEKNKIRHSEQGVAVVEFAVLAVLFLIIVFGLLEFGVMFFQKHYIAGAAREGVRIGVIANNYGCFTSVACDTSRKDAVNTRVTEYLGAVFDPEDLDEVTPVIITRDPEGSTTETRTLSVQVTVENFMTEMISGLVPGYTRPETFTHTATGTYEDPTEKDD